jgi:hypothetical protein
VVFLGESFTTIQIVGAVITIVGALLAVAPQRPRDGVRRSPRRQSATRRLSVSRPPG